MNTETKKEEKCAYCGGTKYMRVRKNLRGKRASRVEKCVFCE